MKYIHIPQKNLTISRLILGTKTFIPQIKIEKKIYKYQTTDPPDTIFAHAIDSGINTVEFASFYPHTLLTTLSKITNPIRKSLILCCRIGYKLDRYHEIIKEKHSPKIFLRKKEIIKEVENLLRIFKTDYLDIVTVCGIKEEKEYLSDVFDAFVLLKNRGYLRFGGLYFGQASLPVLPFFDFYQLTYNILNQEYGEHLEKISKKDITIFSCAPFAGGILSRKYTHPSHFKKDDPRIILFSEEKLTQFKKYIDRLTFLELKSEPARPLKKSRTFIQGALNFVLQNPYISSITFSVSSVAQLKEIIETFDSEPLTAPQIELIKAIVSESKDDL